MSKFQDKIRIDNFSIEELDLSEVEELSDWLPKNGIVDLNIAEKGLILTLHGQNLCQEQIARIDHLISVKEGQRNKAWTKAALDKANAAGHKVVKNREWFAQADDDYIEACNQVAIAKAAKRWFENKADYFQNWHYAMKSFLRRDYSLERLGNFQVGYETEKVETDERLGEFGGDVSAWDE